MVHVMGTSGDLPTGTVTFLFSDIEGSTRLVQQLGDRFVDILESQQRLLRDAFREHGGIELGTEGDSFFVVFPKAGDAVAAAIAAQRAVAGYAWPEDADVRVRMGLHTGEGTLGGANYVGLDVHRAARIASAAHGGQILMSDATRALVESNLGSGSGLRDLGEQRLKDLLKPERIAQIVDGTLQSDFPPIATLTQRPNNLPTQASEFLGRERQVAAIVGLLDGGARLVTLTGPGGIGKTRLSLQAAATRTDQFTDGLFFVDLAPIRDPDEAFEAVVRAVGAPMSSEQGPLEVLKETLAAKRMLLLLDNLEQVIEAANGVADLIQHCPHVSVLATSREALRVRGERVFPVPALSLPERIPRMSAEVAARSEAVRLFVERATEASGSFALTDENAAAVAEVCTRLDGLPLAIELAAARARLFSPADLVHRLRSTLQVGGGARDLPERHQTLRRTIEWSYDLLEAEERDVFRVFSVFSTATIGAVEEVVQRVPPLRSVDVLDRITSLVDKSLVRSLNGSGPQRLSMLATIREFAAERLETEADLAETTRRAHAEYFAAFASGRAALLSGSGRDEALFDLETEVDNLIAAWRLLAASGDLAKLEQLFEPLWALHEARGWYVSAVGFARDLLGVLSDVPSTGERFEQKITLATTLARGLLALRGYTKESEQAYDTVMTMLDEAGGIPQVYPVLRSLASFHLYRGEFAMARVAGHQLLELAERSDDDALRVDANLVVGSNLISSGDIEGLSYLDRSIAVFDPRRHRSGRFRFGPNPGVVAHTTSAFALWVMGEMDRSYERSARALEIARELDHPFTLAYALFHTAFLELWRRDFARVSELAGAAVEVAEEHGYEVWKAVGLVLQGTALVALGQPEKGLEQAERGMALYQLLPTPPVFWPFLLSIHASGLALAGRFGDAIKLVDEARAIVGDRDNMMAAQLPLLKGDLLLMSSGPSEAEPLYQLAFEAAQESGARTIALRAATRLTMLNRQTGRQPDGSDALREIYDSLADQKGTPDLADARALLDAG